MGNRPINRRPWRRKPWAKRRPTRWIELNCTQGSADCVMEGIPILCYSEDPDVRQVRDMWYGDDDMEYADDNTVLLERIVGSINVGALALPDAGGNWALPEIRMGLLVVQEVEDLSTYRPPSLYIREDIEEYQWLWMHEFNSTENAWQNDSRLPAGVRYGRHLDIDLHVKRKLSKKDHLVLLTERSVPYLAGTVVASYTYLMRGLFSTK